MKLWTKEIDNAAKKCPLYYNDGKPLATRKVLVKFFFPCGAATWYITEVDPEPFELEGGKTTRYLYGYCTLDGANYEWGPVLLSELESFKGRFGLGIERDTFVDPLKDDLGKFRKELYEVDKEREERKAREAAEAAKAAEAEKAANA